MTIEEQQVVDVVYKAIDDANQLAPSDAQVIPDLESVLLGEGSVLDSLGLINLIVGVELLLASDLGVEVVLLDEEALINPEGPYRNVRRLVAWALQRIN